MRGSLCPLSPGHSSAPVGDRLCITLPLAQTRAGLVRGPQLGRVQKVKNEGKHNSCSQASECTCVCIAEEEVWMRRGTLSAVQCSLLIHTCTNCSCILWTTQSSSGTPRITDETPRWVCLSIPFMIEGQLGTDESS